MNTNNTIENEDDDLKGMAPHLSKMKNNNPFKANEDYFKSFNSKLQNEINDFEEIKNEAPALSNIPKYNPFEVPQHYFDDLPSKIQQVVVKSKSTATLLEWLILIIKPRFAVPMLCTMLIAFAGIRFMNNNATLPQTELANEMNAEELLYNIDEGTLMESVNANGGIETNTVSSEDLTIKDYLIENNIDENNLYANSK